MSAWTIMGVAGKIKQPTSQPAGYELKLAARRRSLAFDIFRSFRQLLLSMQDTFRGRVCECPLVDGVQFKGDGYSHCEGEFILFLNQQKLMKNVII